MNGIGTQRRAGVLLHPTALPSGRLDGDATRFIDWLGECGFGVWQMLPLGPPVVGLSPYSSASAFAGHAGLVPAESAAQASHSDIPVADVWLDDYVLFATLKQRLGGAPWWQWPEPLREREPGALAQARESLAVQIQQLKSEQAEFFGHFARLRALAHASSVSLFGDLPLFVADDSADVWAHPQWFKLHRDGPERGRPRVVAGVPPDYFSATGQRWGNPIYDWDALARDGFRWWLDRVAVQLAQFDLIRIDHFRGLAASWEIPAADPVATGGTWVEVPGAALLDAVNASLGEVPFVAEDLGIITPDVERLRERHQLPGMKILQFAFDSDDLNPYLPANHVENCVVYTGTHDNDTTVGWYSKLAAGQRERVRSVLGMADDSEMPWAMIDAALASPARLAVIPMQDLLGLGTEARFNTPGTTTGNWEWRFDWSQIDGRLTSRLRDRLRDHGRA
ncbi:MAG: 4-alpha-glucanotransferase [Chromatiales bacterium]|nr:4-alpha-glucanotransferase [Chromatiales bacterium]